MNKEPNLDVDLSFALSITERICEALHKAIRSLIRIGNIALMEKVLNSTY